MPEIAITVVALGFGAMGVGALVAPAAVTRQFDMPALSIAGRNEVRAVYGGFGLAMALVLAIAVVAPAFRPGICLAIAAALAGMVLGRLASAAVDRKLPRWPAIYLAIEAVAAALLAYAV